LLVQLVQFRDVLMKRVRRASCGCDGSRCLSSHGGDRRKARRALWLAAAGGAAGLALTAFAALGDMSVRYVIILACRPPF
jgi:hypothetical protein